MRIALHFLAVTAVSAIVALVLTGIYLLDFRSDCHGNGGTFHLSTTTATCTY